jgi:DNA-directed RNA polymerase II subunit RPB2
MNEQVTWAIIDKYFNDNPSGLVSHQLDSYNQFFNTGIKQIFKEKNPIRIMKQQNPKTNEFRFRCNLYLGGKEGNRLYYGKPVIYDENREHYMYPNEARLRNMTYGITIHYDVEVEFLIRDDATDEIETKTILLEKIFLGRFPIMVMSDLCILKGLDKKVKFELGECKNDYGAYFIIDGLEKCIIPQEKFADNMLYIRDKESDIFSHSAEIRSVSEDASKPIRTLSIKIVMPTPSLSNNQIVVNVPNVRKPVPLFILMRALGIESDKEIIEFCLLDMESYKNYIDLFIPSIHDAGRIFTQEGAINYIGSFTKGHTDAHALEILTNYLLPHVGEMNFRDKAYFIGYMVRQLLSVYMKENKATDRDNFRFKRVELPGTLLYDLFKEYYTLQQRDIYLKIDKEFLFHEGQYNSKEGFFNLIEENYKAIFSDRIVENGFKKAFKGKWGSEEHTARVGVVQDLNRLSYNSYISHLRKINLPLDASAKVVGPRLLHSSQWGIIDPVDTPDGGNAGLHKHMTIIAHITTGCSSYPVIKWLRLHSSLKLLAECSPFYVSTMCKVIVNGNWIGVISNPKETQAIFKENRRVGIIPPFISIQWNIETNTIYIYTDSGRLCRPIFYINEEGKPSYENKPILENISADKFTWEQLITGFAKRKDEDFSIMSYKFYSNVAELYSASDLKQLKETRGIIDYMDTSEAEAALIAMKPGYDIKNKFYTHVEIHPSLILGVMGNQIVFPENNQLPRDLFACGQAKQAVSVYNTNFQTRMDKMGVVLNNGQIPLVKSRYLKYINNEEHPCGENTIVAIMSYNGYNVEDSILFNEGSLKRGLFRTTYYTTYQSREESSKVGKSQTDSHFVNIEKENVIGKKPGYDYSELDDYGLIKENTPLDDKKVIIGKVTKNLDNPESSIDSSSFPKKGQVGFVDKTFITEGEEGFRIAKVRVRDQRMPAIGDKFSSRCGQKGTLGVVIPEEDMPYTASGIRPDIIINPHAIPSRMTIGQLVETIMGKACSMYGAFGDCTAFVNNGSKHKIFGQLLTNQGMHSSGGEILYNGQTGEQLETEIFMGPTYYMRLKHMVKDKINYRALGPRTALTRQPVQGRANDGGLRIGEMERDGLIAHGVTKFLQESMLIRGDEYFMAVCNKTGTIAIYNNSYNLFLSPFADGPIKFSGTLTDGMNVQNISRYGRTFSIVRIPYAFKLLIQELQTMNVQLRLITEDNIDQLTSLSFSDNINKINSKFISGEKIFIDKAASVDDSITKSAIKMIPVGLSPDKKPAGQTKLFANKFLKFKMPKFNTTPSNLLNTQDKIAITDLDRAFAGIHRTVNEYKTKLDEIGPDDFRKLSENLDLYAGLKRHFMKKGFPFATNASLKMYELIKELDLIDCNKPIRAFCDAELPGAFIVTINHFVKTICKTPDFDWVGSSYYPEDAASAGDLTILGDKYGFYTNNRSNWLMGPKPNALPIDVPDTTGDLMNGAVVVTVANSVHARFESTSGATLATSDAGIDVSEDYSNQECDTSLLNYGQIIAAILALAPGGHMVTKQYTFNRPFSRSLIALVSLLFDEAYVVKPVTSRPGNSEVYIVGKGFLGIEKPLAEELVQRFSVYSGNKDAPCKYAPLFKPEDYKAIDEELLKAATKIHTEQQVEFLNEMYDYYQNKEYDLDLKDIYNKTQKEWLKKYPLVDINKADMMYYKKNPNPNPLAPAPLVSAAASAISASQVMSTLNTAASTAYNALDNFGNFVSDTLTGQGASASASVAEAPAQEEAPVQAPAALQMQAPEAALQIENTQPSILSVVEEEKEEEGEEKPEESNKKIITI